MTVLSLWKGSKSPFDRAAEHLQIQASATSGLRAAILSEKQGGVEIPDRQSKVRICTPAASVHEGLLFPR